MSEEMQLQCYWTIGGDFVIGDAADDNSPVITVKFHEKRLRTQAIDTPGAVSKLIFDMMRSTPHIYSEEPV